MASRNAYVRSFRELIVYRKSRSLAQDIFQISKRFPREEMYSLTDQIRRSSRSVGAQIAEAWAKRRYEKHFVSKLTDADAEQQETQHWLEVAYDCGYISQPELNQLLNPCLEVGRMLQSMMNKSAQFCAPENTGLLREEGPSYFMQDETESYRDE
ncbi:MAG: four helix bundle protein [Anaerolineales bacterium]|nr:four helix bundle protein [Anaerolineales bacterium]